MNFVDTHCHLFLEEFDSDRLDIVIRAQNSGVKKLILPNVDNQTIFSLKESVKLNPNVCFPALGVHPCSIKENFKEELSKIEKEIRDKTPIAIGEVGIDLYWDKTFASEQIEALEIQISWAKSLDIPLILHTRDAFEECFEIVKKHQDIKGVFHAFSGNEEQVKKVVDIGFYFGIGGVVTFKNGGLDKILSNIPLDLLLLETDAPYLTPAPHRGKRNEPAYIPIIAEKIASIYQMPIKEISEKTWKNTHELFAL